MLALPTVVVLEADDVDLDMTISGLQAFAAVDLSPIPAMGLGQVAELILVGTASLNGLVLSAEFLYRKFRRGLIIEDHAGQIVVRSSTDLPRGIILMRASDGDVKIDDASKIRSLITDWLAALAEAKSK